MRVQKHLLLLVPHQQRRTGLVRSIAAFPTRGAVPATALQPAAKFKQLSAVCLQSSTSESVVRCSEFRYRPFTARRKVHRPRSWLQASTGPPLASQWQHPWQLCVPGPCSSSLGPNRPIPTMMTLNNSLKPDPRQGGTDLNELKPAVRTMCRTALVVLPGI